MQVKIISHKKAKMFSMKTIPVMKNKKFLKD